jgi:hypothetical protein
MSEDKKQSENDISYTTDNYLVSMSDELYDDFMCLMRTDGSTIANSGRVTAIGRKVPKTITSLNGLKLELPIPLSPSLVNQGHLTNFASIIHGIRRFERT